MKISLDWLGDFVTWDGTPDELAARLTQNGLNVEGVEEFVIEFPGVVVGRVETCERHPNADKLSLCTVFDGEQTRQVVCGAPNVRAGLHVLLARPGAVLPGGIKLKKSKIRGVESHGMICSAVELGIGEDSAGIMELEGDPAPGTTADELYGWRDTVLDIEVTPNRPDWLSHYGVAREIAAFSGALLDTPQLWSPPKAAGKKEEGSVEIADFADCPRYTAHVIHDIEPGPSPRWMRNRLLAVGARPINNVVDITNYVMFELGQPLHAFDFNKINGKVVSIRRAESGTNFPAITGGEYELGPDHLVIADAGGPIALAGVMGGTRTQVDDKTTDILLESAFFDPGLVRRTSRQLQLSSDSSYRFEREADWDMVMTAALRTCHLVQKLAAGKIESAGADRQNPDRKGQPQIQLRVSQVNRLLGTSLNAAEVINYLQSLGLQTAPLGQARDRNGGEATLVATIPGFRRDLVGEVDLIEEVARLHGFDNIETRADFRAGGAAKRKPGEILIRLLRDYLAGVGYHEIVTSSFMSRDDADRLALGEDDPRREVQSVLNPRHGGDAVLRTSLIPSMLRVVQRNINADSPLPLRFFQINRAFLPPADEPRECRREDEKLLPREPMIFQIALSGLEGVVHGDVPADLMALKGLIEALALETRLDLTLEPGGDQPYLTDGLAWRIRSGEKIVGDAGAVGRPVLRAFELDAATVMAEIDLTALDIDAATVRYVDFPRFPAVKRDLSLLLPAGTAWATVEQKVRDAGGPLLDSVELFDVYRGEGLADVRSALGIRLKFQSAKGSLKGKSVDKAISAITGALESDLGVTLRG